MKHLTIYILCIALSGACMAQSKGDIVVKVCNEYGCKNEYRGNIDDDPKAYQDTKPITECYGYDCQSEQTFIEGGDL